MTEDLARVLSKFHEEILRPDIERIVEAAVTKAQLETSGQIDGLCQRFDRLETEYHALVLGLRRVEEAVGALDRRMGALEGRLEGVETRLDGLQSRIARLELEVAALKSQLEAAVVGDQTELQGTLRADMRSLQTRVVALEAEQHRVKERLDRASTD